MTGDPVSEPKRVGFKVRVDVWVDVPNEASARGAVNRMVANSRDCDNNGDVDIVDVQEWDYDG